MDECSQGMNDCHGNATCNNTEGSYNCSCKNGFTGDGFTCEGENSKEQAKNCVSNVNHIASLTQNNKAHDILVAIVVFSSNNISDQQL